MNWGHGLTITFIAFAGLMIFMTVKSFQQNIDLVTPEYYREELAYQQRINEIKNAAGAQQVSITEMDDAFVLDFPSNPKEGYLHFYRPSDQSLDKYYNLTASKNETISSEGLVSGYYILKLHWSDQDQAFYQEKGVVIP